MEDVDLGEPVSADEIGKARVLVEGSDITMVAWGRQVRLIHTGGPAALLSVKAAGLQFRASVNRGSIASTLHRHCMAV